MAKDCKGGCYEFPYFVLLLSLPNTDSLLVCTRDLQRKKSHSTLPVQLLSLGMQEKVWRLELRTKATAVAVAILRSEVLVENF